MPTQVERAALKSLSGAWEATILATHVNDAALGVMSAPKKNRLARRHERLKVSESLSLRDAPLFARVDDETISQLTAEAKFEIYNPGETIFRQDDPVSTINIILNGYAKVLRIAPNGDETLVAIRADGETIVEPLYGPHEFYGVCAEAISQVSLVKIATTRFMRMMSESDSLNAAALQDAKEKSAALIYEIEALKSQTADQRLAQFILALCPAGQERCRFRLPYDKRLIAAQLGVKQETLSRAFAKLREIGVRTETRDILVENLSRLKEVCELAGRSATSLPSERRSPISRENAA